MGIDLEDIMGWESRVLLCSRCKADGSVNKKVEMITNPCENSIRYAVIDKHVVIATVQDLQKALDIYNRL